MCSDVIIKPADTVGAIAILVKTDYVNEANKQLSVSTFYKALPNDPTQDYKQIVKDKLAELVKKKNNK